MARYVSRHGALATADAKTELTDLGSDGTGLDPIKVLPGENSIKQIWVVGGNEAPTKTACGHATTYSIEGTGVVGGPHHVLGYGYTCLATGNTGFYRIRGPAVLNVDIGLIPGGDVFIYAAQDGTDAGTPNVGATLAITGAGSSNKKYETRYGTVTALSTSTALSGMIGGGSKTTISPGAATRISRIWTGYANELALATAAGGSCIASITGGLAEGEFNMVVGAHGSLSTTTGSTVGFYPIADSGPLNLRLSGGPITMVGEQTGVDHGTAMPMVTVELSK